MIFVWVFGVVFVVIWFVNKVWFGFLGGGFWVLEEDELIGLNVVEYGVMFGMGVL